MSQVTRNLGSAKLAKEILQRELEKIKPGILKRMEAANINDSSDVSG